MKVNGFHGCKTISELRRNFDLIPKRRGVYMVIDSIKRQRPPKFLKKGTGGFFKGRNPNIPIKDLRERWVKGAITLYIGKAGGNRNSSTLRKRIKKYLDFGQGRDVGHWGGRLIWQIPNSAKLVLCWKVLKDKAQEPSYIERDLIELFQKYYQRKPFANLV